MKKIFSIIFTFFVILILFYMTIIIKWGAKYESPNFTKTAKWNIYFDIKNNKIETKQESKLKANYINISDKILSFDSNFIVENEKNIKLEKWIYLTNINSLDKKYTINWTNFSIETNWPTSFFVDSSDETRVIIFSLDSILKLNFLWKDNEVFNTAYIYPNQSIAFNSTKNFLIKNADLLKITQNLSLNYFIKNIFAWENISPDFSKSFFSKNTETKENTEKLFTYIFLEIKEKKDFLKNFENKKFFSLPGENLMLEYDFLLLNKEKKIIYLKNQILKEIQNLIISKERNSEKIEKYLENLRNIDIDSYSEMLEIIEYFNSSINLVKKSNNDLKIIFQKIIDKKAEISVSTNFLNLNSTFFNYNFIWNKNFYSEIKKIIWEKTNSKIEEKEKNYFVFFLQQLITANLSEENTDFEDTIDIFKNYTKSSINYYQAKNETDPILKNKIIETWIKNFASVISTIVYKIEENFFDRNSENLLVRKNVKTLSKNSVNTLASSIKDIYDKFYIDNQNVTVESDVKNDFIKNLEKFEELKLALLDYKQYNIKYNEKNKSLLNENTEKTVETLSIPKARKYLSRFNWINFSGTIIEVKKESYCLNPKTKEEKWDDYCYKISNLKVWDWNELTFLLFPIDFNKITILSDNSMRNYILDEIEDNSKNSESKWKFEDFFTNLFSSSEKKTENFVEEKENKESDIIRAFKQTTLLWKNGTLSKLSPILNFRYNDIIVEENKSWYKINILNSVFSYKVWEKQYKWILKSEYKFKSWTVNSFFNPELKIEWNTIKISGFVKLENFSEIIKEMFKNMEDLLNYINFINQNDSGSEIKIIYFANNNKFQISSDNVKISIIWDKIENFTNFWKKILEKNENMNKITELLKDN